MPTEAAALEQIRRQVEAQNKNFTELPDLREYIDVYQNYQGKGRSARLRELRRDFRKNGYARNAAGQVIGLQLYGVQLTDYAVLKTFQQLTVLSLEDTNLAEIDFVKELTALTELSLLGRIFGNRISDLSPLVGLTNLTRLDLARNQISDLTPLAGLTALKTLVLDANQISDLTPLDKLTALKTLVLDANQISDLTPLAGLTALTTLELGDNQFSDLTPLAGLTALTTLALEDTQLKDLSPLAGLTALTELYLRNNQFSDLTPLAGLTALTQLGVGSNQIRDLTPLANLTALTRLGLGGNQIRDLTPLANLTAMTRLFLQNNQIRDLIPLANLTALTGLGLGDNQISDLTPLVGLIRNTDLQMYWEEESWKVSSGINLYENPLETPPVEIVKQGRDAVLEWFKAAAEGQRRPLNEVKVLLVGDGGSGKTSLVNRLLDDTFDPREAQTDGIQIRDWEVTLPGDAAGPDAISAHIWDFGGQEIMHATHQFFLSKRSLYVLVLDGRKDEKTEYWLKHIQSFGGDSPVLVVLNKIDQNPGFELNRRFLQEKYPAIAGFCRVSCQSGAGVAEFGEQLTHTLTTVELLRATWPQSWFEVKTRLESMTAPYISYDAYQQLCQQVDVETSAEDTLVRFLHDLGVILHFSDLHLCDLHVLDPEWVTGAVYTLITADQLAAAHGLLRLDQLGAILASNDEDAALYPRRTQPYIIELMKKFELCYKLNDQALLLPQLLPVEEPDFAFEDAGALRFRFKYEFLPRSIMPRFIVRQHLDIKDDLRWRTGVVLEDTDLQAAAVVRSDDEARAITLRVSGAQRRDYFQILLKTLRDLHADFQKLGEKELVPCNCPECAASSAPHYYDYGYLLRLQCKRRPTVNCQRSTEDVSIADLMEGIEIMNPEALYEWDVFLSYSSDDAPIVEQIVRDLQAEEIRCWWDREQIRPGDNILGQIERGLQRSRRCLLCFSRNQQRSGWSRAEYETLLTENLSGRSRQPLIPLVLDDLAPADLPLLCRRLRAERYTDADGYRRVLDLLRRDASV